MRFTKSLIFVTWQCSLDGAACLLTLVQNYRKTQKKYVIKIFLLVQLLDYQLFIFFINLIHNRIKNVVIWDPMYSALILAARLRLPRHTRG
eukprot:TRINITY_DN5504_c0_g1_i1.p1 TRINITY_DN5504_c0_g1~~TRINITY_DN5504_c0_g1_i1.p1  ORF type:complete len:91 (+),score=13.31 TRINITY_DN5504_c0_g1_i1:36-308(+)